MEIKQIKELMTVMGRTGTKRLSIRKGDFELVLEREENGRPLDSSLLESEERAKQLSHQSRTDLALSRGSELPTLKASSPTIAEPSAVKEEIAGTYITSPMVGTFYTSPSPGDPSFVKVGDKVEKNTVVCIIEAMKVMNEIKAGVSGTVAEVLVETGHPVEFSTKLFRIV